MLPGRGFGGKDGYNWKGFFVFGYIRYMYVRERDIYIYICDI